VIDFLMSGADEVLDAITALAAHGFKGVRLPFAGVDWLSVKEVPTPETTAAIASIVSRVDPGARRI
jgi:hypothetical protein